MKKKLLYLVLVPVLTISGFLVSKSCAGAPPGVAPPQAGPGPLTGVRKGAISFELGYYSPSLKTFNDYQKHYGLPEVGGNLSLNLKVLFGAPGAYPYVGAGYWASSCEKLDFKYKVTLIPVSIGVQVPLLTRTLPAQLMVSLDVGGDIPIAFLKVEDTENGNYFTAMALGYDVGAKVGCEYFVLPSLSVGGFVGWTFLGKTGQLTVWDSTIPGIEVDDKLIDHRRKKLVFDLAGINLMFALRLWF